MRNCSAGRYLFLICVFAITSFGADFNNGSFETGNLTGWRTYFNGVASGDYQISNEAYQGDCAVSMNITNAGANNSQGNSALDTWNNPIELYGQKEFLLKFAAKKISVDSSRLHIKVLEFSSSGGFLGAFREWFVTPSNSYQQYSYFYSVKNSQTSRIVLSFRVVDSSSVNLAVGSYLLDEVVLEDCARIYNGGFEDGTRFWRWYDVSGASGSATVSSEAFSGDNAVRLKVTAGGGNHGLDRDDFKIPVSAGETIILEFAAKKISTGAEQLRLSFAEHAGDNNQTYLSRQTNKLFDVGDQYSKYICSYQTKSSDVGALNVIFKSWDGAASTGEFLIDDIKIVTDILPNSGFESGLELWRCYATTGSQVSCSLEIGDAAEGQKAARFEVTQALSGSDHGLDRYDFMPEAQYGDKLFLSFKAKEPIAQDRRLMLSAVEYDSEGTSSTNSAHKLFNPDGGYRQFYFYYNVKGLDTKNLNLCFKIYTADGETKADGLFLIDDAVMRVGNANELSDLNYDGVTDDKDLQLFADNWTDSRDTDLSAPVAAIDNSMANETICTLEGSFDFSEFDGLNIAVSSSTLSAGLLELSLRQQDNILGKYEFDLAGLSQQQTLIYADLNNLTQGVKEDLSGIDNLLFKAYPDTSSDISLNVSGIDAVMCDCEYKREDLNLDYKVNLLDLRVIAEQWVR